MRIQDQEIIELLNGIFTTMFETELRHADADRIEDSREAFTGTVQIHGVWSGAAMLSCSAPLAGKLTSAMLGIEDLSDDEICDAVGELTNLTAGALQSLVPAPSELSPPSLVQGRNYRLVFPHSRLINQVHLECHGGMICVMVFESEDVKEDAMRDCLSEETLH